MPGPMDIDEPEGGGRGCPSSTNELDETKKLMGGEWNCSYLLPIPILTIEGCEANPGAKERIENEFRVSVTFKQTMPHYKGFGNGLCRILAQDSLAIYRSLNLVVALVRLSAPSRYCFWTHWLFPQEIIWNSHINHQKTNNPSILNYKPPLPAGGFCNEQDPSKLAAAGNPGSSADQGHKDPQSFFRMEDEVPGAPSTEPAAPIETDEPYRWPKEPSPTGQPGGVISSSTPLDTPYSPEPGPPAGSPIDTPPVLDHRPSPHSPTDTPPVLESPSAAHFPPGADNYLVTTTPCSSLEERARAPADSRRVFSIQPTTPASDELGPDHAELTPRAAHKPDPTHLALDITASEPVLPPDHPDSQQSFTWLNGSLELAQDRPPPQAPPHPSPPTPNQDATESQQTVNTSQSSHENPTTESSGMTSSVLELPLTIKEYLSKKEFYAVREIIHESKAFCRISVTPESLRFSAVGTQEQVSLAMVLMSIKIKELSTPSTENQANQTL
ncbi:hypothetical protein PTTG_08421 [Puccinia triticina 1-1 BBBD Race 1]|uniref:Uncharacterized protein n=1 Tax=Puccinia triticina (isolate 1-1 / race 1 (BBBD)) TaxID=630390 RepID=A0A180G496_PUCT1|nr:hypothetical protein PTTG_08421 [Puccinia triticina 1-1 BBBD Race 1]